MGLSCWLSGKECACQIRIHRRHEFHPWVRKIPCRREWQPTPVIPVESLAWKIPWTVEPGRLQSMGSERVRHLATQQQWCSGCGPFPCLIPSKAGQVLLHRRKEEGVAFAARRGLLMVSWDFPSNNTSTSTCPPAEIASGGP